ncbi:MAG: 30S ribosomal protein S2 [Patescibacteria group bacterium]
MSNVPSLTELLEAGAHFGHRSSRWHPKMAPFIFGTRGGVHITNLEETQKHLSAALDYVSSVASRGGMILFVGTKPQARSIVAKYATETGMPHVTNRWLGGTLTNFTEIKRLIKKFLDLKDKEAKGELKKYTKKEQLWFSRDIVDMDRKVGGVQSMLSTPEAMFIVDIKAEKTALAEAKHKGVKVIAICDTNVNPTDVDFCIPANDDGVKSIELITSLIAEAIKEGKANAVKAAAVAAVEKEKAAQAKSEEEARVKAEAVEAVAELDDKIAEELAEEKTKEKVS